MSPHLLRPLECSQTCRSFQRASKAQKEGIFKTEIVPLEAIKIDPATGARSKVIISEDDGIRHGTTAESLSKIKGAFPQWGEGKTTGGNASQVTDGAAAVLLMTRRRAEALGLKILAKHVTTSVAGTYYSYLSTPQILKLTSLSRIRAGTSDHGYRPEHSNPNGPREGRYN